MPSTVWQHYFETSVDITEDPLLLAARLARSQLRPGHVVYERAGRWSYAAGVLAEITVDRDGTRLRTGTGTGTGTGTDTLLTWDGRPLEQVRRLLGALTVERWRAYGWAAFELSYATAGQAEHLGEDRLLHLVVPQAEARIEPGRAHLRAADQDTMADLLSLVRAPAGSGTTDPRPLDVRAVGRAPYQQAVALAVEDITAGLLEKVILSRVVDVPYALDLPATYVRGRRHNNPARSFLLDLGGLEVAGFSPEIVVTATADGTVAGQPLAGTRALTGDSAADHSLRADLFASPKEVYEHAVSVRAGIDDLATVCVPDTVGVPEFMAVRERGSVQHLASRVAGRLADGNDAWDAFAALFPAVTASGIPKGNAYRAIRSYENEPRGLYSGAVLTVDQDGALDAALVLRSVYRKDGRTWLRAGAGIVGQSTPEREFEETSEKLDSVARHLVPATTRP